MILALNSSTIAQARQPYGAHRCIRPSLAVALVAYWLWSWAPLAAMTTQESAPSLDDPEFDQEIAFGVNRDQRHYLHQAQTFLSLHLLDQLRGLQTDPRDCDQALTRLILAVERDSMSRVDRGTGNTLELEAHGTQIFEQAPVLPPEEVQDGRWQFEVVRLDLVPRHLFVHALTFKASRTIRLRWVRFIFADGSSRMHDRWASMEARNGRAFRKETYLPWLKVGVPTGPSQAKRLRAIEFLGSAQDSHYTAQLDFMFRVPDPNHKPSLERLNTVTRIHRDLRNLRYEPRACLQALDALNELPLP